MILMMRWPCWRIIARNSFTLLIIKNNLFFYFNFFSNLMNSSWLMLYSNSTSYSNHLFLSRLTWILLYLTRIVLVLINWSRTLVHMLFMFLILDNLDTWLWDTWQHLSNIKEFVYVLTCHSCVNSLFLLAKSASLSMDSVFNPLSFLLDIIFIMTLLDCPRSLRLLLHVTRLVWTDMTWRLVYRLVFILLINVRQDVLMIIGQRGIFNLFCTLIWMNILIGHLLLLTSFFWRSLRTGMLFFKYRLFIRCVLLKTTFQKCTIWMSLIIALISFIQVIWSVSRAICPCVLLLIVSIQIIIIGPLIINLKFLFSLYLIKPIFDSLSVSVH